MTIGERIKQRRKELGMSAEDLAEKLNKNRATIYRYENDSIGNLPISILEPLAEVLETSPSYLMGWEPALSAGDENEFSLFQTLFARQRVILSDPNPRGGSYLLSYGEEAFEITVGYYHSLTREIDSFVRFKLEEIHSRESERACEPEYLILNAARPRTDQMPEEFTDEMRQHDEDIMDDPDF